MQYAQRPLPSLFGCVLFLHMVLNGSGFVLSQEVRTWTSFDNMFRTQATLVDADATSARLRREADGAEISVDLQRLSRADQIYVQLFLEERTNGGKSDRKGLAVKVPEFALEVVNAETGVYRAQPLGMLRIPRPGFEWQVERDHPVTTLTSVKAGDPETFTLTVLPTAVTSEERASLINRDWEWTAQSIVQAGKIFRHSMLPRNKPRIDDVEWIYFEVSESEKDPQTFVRHQVNYCFRSGYTIRIEHTGPQVIPGRKEGEEVVADLHRVYHSEEDQLVPMTAGLKREMEERIALLKGLIAAKDYDGLVSAFLSPGDFKTWSQSSDSDRKKAVTRFIKENGPVLASIIPSMDMDSAWATSAGDQVLFFSERQLPPIELSWNRRWSLRYPHIIPDADLGSLRMESPE